MFPLPIVPQQPSPENLRSRALVRCQASRANRPSSSRRKPKKRSEELGEMEIWMTSCWPKNMPRSSRSLPVEYSQMVFGLFLAKESRVAAIWVLKLAWLPSTYTQLLWLTWSRDIKSRRANDLMWMWWGRVVEFGLEHKIWYVVCCCARDGVVLLAPKNHKLGSLMFMLPVIGSCLK